MLMSSKIYLLYVHSKEELTHRVTIRKILHRIMSLFKVFSFTSAMFTQGASLTLIPSLLEFQLSCIFVSPKLNHLQVGFEGVEEKYRTMMK